MGARTLSATELSDFSLLLLVLTSSVAFQRAAFLAPGFASQRGGGRAGVPLRWLLFLSAPIAVVSAVLIIFTYRVPSLELYWILVVLAAALPTVANDVLRSHLIGNSSPVHALVADTAIALIALFGFLALGERASVQELVFIYSLAAWAGLAIMLCVAGFNRTYLRFPPMSLRRTWRLGKWAGLDNLMSASANLVPMMAATLVLGYDFAGTYRVLQAALGPLNILSNAILTSFGLDAWQLRSRIDLLKLSSRVRSLSLRLIAFTCLYLVAGEMAILWISNLQGEDVLRIAIIVGVAGLMSSACIAPQAGALALGYQKSGAIIRVFVLGFALIVTFGSIGGGFLPWGDPIAAVALFAGTANLLGWTVAYRRAQKLERALLPE